MPANKGSAAPSSVAEGIQGIAAAVSAAMMAPDAAPYLKALDSLQKAALGLIHGGQKGPPQAGQPQPGQQPGAPGGGLNPPMGGGTNIGQLMGGQPAGPSGGEQSPDDVRRATAAQAQMAS